MSPVKILIVDDESGIRKVLARFLKIKGYETLEAESQEAAIRNLSLAGSYAALLDMNMPDNECLDLLKKLLKINPSLRVILMSGKQDEEKIKSAMALGAQGFIMKPFDFSELDSMLSSILEVPPTQRT